MSIQIQSKGTIPAVDLNQLHIDQLLLRVSRDDSTRGINAIGAAYGIDADNKSIFSASTMQVDEKDFNTTLIAWAIQNGHATSVEDALSQYAAAKLAVTISDPDVFTLMASFEMGIGKIFEVAGKISVEGLS